MKIKGSLRRRDVTHIKEGDGNRRQKREKQNKIEGNTRERKGEKDNGEEESIKGKGEEGKGEVKGRLLRRDVTYRKPSLDLVLVCFFVLERP